MRITILCFFICLGLSVPQVQGNIVPESDAQTLAKAAFTMKNTLGLKSVNDQKIKSSFSKTFEGAPSYYIYNFEPQGFIVISAEDNYNAVLAYSDESHFEFENEAQSEVLFSHLSRHEQHIAFTRVNNLKAKSKVKSEWNTLKEVNKNGVNKDDPDGIVVAPMTTTKWNQGQFYNSFCPATPDTEEEGPDGGTYAGCSPIAMAQLIKFHNYPPRGNGFNTYEDPDFGTQTADFCNTDYNWSNMPDSLGKYNDDVAEFVYHVAVSTNTYFSPVYTSTYISYMRDALVNYFGYDESAGWFYDDNDDFHWVAKRDLDAGRPIILTGRSVFGGAHTWVTDGYGYFSDPQPGFPAEYFHFNWGWGGNNNGWYLDVGASWDPLPNQTNVENISYYEDRYVVHNIFPSEEECASLTRLYESGVSKSTAYMHVAYSQGPQQVSFRYRKAGTVDWIEKPATSNYFQYINLLEEGTDYEYQARRQCCGDKWSDYSESFFFTTEGTTVEIECEKLREEELSTSSISENFAYLYTSQPYGNVTNQFRYRVVGQTDWLYTTQADFYYRALFNLEEGSDYEFQVSHECQAQQWTEYSESGFFTTAGEGGTGGGDDDCEMSDISLYTSSTGDHVTYVYTSQPFGQVDNQFRYKILSESDWIESDVSDNYYRFLKGLEAGSEYEYQVSHECSAGTWSNWSDSEYFTTTGTSTGGGGGDDCASIQENGLYSSSTTSNFTYVYTLQPLGAVDNQFRYRPVGGQSWTLTDESSNYYRALSGLNSSTEYEYQVSQECTDGVWSDFSVSAYFTTLSTLININSKNQFTSHSPISYQDLETRLLKDLETKTFPNPIADILNFESNTPFTNGDQISVIDVTGRVIYNAALSEGQLNFTINTSNWESGMYILEYTSDLEKQIHKVIKR